MKTTSNKKELKEKRGKNKAVTLFISVFSIILLLSIISADSDQYRPYLHKASVGDVPKLETFGTYQTQLFPGAGTFSYPIEVSRGTVGLQPQLSLDYNSQSVLQRPGIVGFELE